MNPNISLLAAVHGRKINSKSLEVTQSQLFFYRLRRKQRKLIVEYQVVCPTVIGKGNVQITHSDLTAIVESGC